MRSGGSDTLNDHRHRWGVPLAAVGLVLAVWVSLQLAGSAPAVEMRVASSELSVSGDLPGFRADAWYLPDDELLGFVGVPEGSFLMGSDPSLDPLAFDIERWSTTSAQGRVELPNYFIGRFEVTVAQFRVFAHESGRRIIDSNALGSELSHPVVGVSWTDAVAYTQWLQGVLMGWSGTPAALDSMFGGGWKIGLPSEAEWEKAARGGDARIFPWGNEQRTDRANYRARGTTAVGSFECPECPFGLADMSGNVWEMTRSPYQPYPYDSSDDRDDLQAESLWVMRGDSFSEAEQNIRAAIRGGIDPGARRPDIGFRLVISRF